MSNGICEACGSTEGVSRLTLAMVRPRSRYAWETNRFGCRLCRNCREKIFRVRFNLWLAGIAGVVCSIWPFLTMPSFEWVEGRVWVVLVAILVGVIFPIRFTFANATLLKKLPAYLRLAEDSRLANAMSGKFIGLLLLVYGLMAVAWLVAASWERSRQDSWASVCGTVTESECRVRERRTRNGQVGFLADVRYRYVCETNGNRYAGMGYGVWKCDTRRANHCWTVGAPVTVYCDPDSPVRSTVGKIDLSPFKTSVCIALGLAGLYMLVSVSIGTLPTKLSQVGTSQVDTD